jgi:cytochrome c biogenesis protein CcdA
MLIVESHFDITAVERSIPTLVIGDQILIGETEVRDIFPGLVAEGLEQGGVPFPDVPGIDPSILVSVQPEPIGEGGEVCETDESCEVEAPIFVAYFYQTGCNECSRVDADLVYLNSKYPQMQVVEFNIYDHADLATWMIEQIGFEGDFNTPALFIGEDVVIGEEIHPETIIPILEKYRETGTEPVWLEYDPEQGQESIIDRFKNMGWLAVVAAGLIDGINPCAFATLIFFVSYLTLSGRRGKEVLLVGGAFTLGVFLAYLAVGLGLYQLLDLVGSTLDIIAKVVYALTGVFCLVLAVLSFIDYRKARQGKIDEMLLNLPEPLRNRINATIRKGRKTSNYMVGAFVAGILISFLELACTGQVYLPTIIFVSSIPEMRLQALLYLVIYNLLFILPLVVIFVLVYFGTTSKDLTRFLQERAALVKFAMGIVFIILGGWLLISLVL